MDIVQLPLHVIDEDTDQPRYRFGEESLQELMNSIEELGLLSPIKVRTMPDGRYKIIYGNRRYKATLALGRPTIPCIVTDTTDETEIYLEQIAENLTREGFTPVEEAEAFDKLLHNPKFNSSVKFLAGKLGKPESYIKNKCELLKFGTAVKKLVVSGTQIRKDQLTEEQLLPLKDLPPEYRDSLALIMAKDEMPVSDVKKIAKLFKDKDISESTKGKLLFKSGPGLLETWSVHRLNKAEKEAKAAAAQEAAERKAAEEAAAQAEAERKAAETAAAQAAAERKAAEMTAAAASALESGAAAAAQKAAVQETPRQDAGGTLGAAGGSGASTETVASAALPALADETPLAALEARLNRLLDALQEAAPTPQERAAIERLDSASREASAGRLDAMAAELKQRAAEWRGRS